MGAGGTFPLYGVSLIVYAAFLDHLLLTPMHSHAKISSLGRVYVVRSTLVSFFTENQCLVLQHWCHCSRCPGNTLGATLAAVAALEIPGLRQQRAYDSNNHSLQHVCAAVS